MSARLSGVKVGGFVCAAAASVWSGCAQSGPPDLLPTPAPHRTVQVAPDETAYGPRVTEDEEAPGTIAAAPEPVVHGPATVKPAWWFDGERTEDGERVVCVEALASDLAGARRAVARVAGGAFGPGAAVEIRELTATPLAHPGGALRYVAYAMVAQVSGSGAGDAAG